MKLIRKSFWIISGSIFVGLGLLGAFLPILPATPFLLLAAFCYGRGSDRFHHWLVNRSWLGGYIRDFQTGRGIPLPRKMLIIGFMWMTTLINIGLFSFAWWLKVALVIFAIGVTIHIFKMKTWHPESSPQPDTIPIKEPTEGIL